jgi:hypothetical protein
MVPTTLDGFIVVTKGPCEVGEQAVSVDIEVKAELVVVRPTVRSGTTFTFNYVADDEAVDQAFFYVTVGPIMLSY